MISTISYISEAATGLLLSFLSFYFSYMTILVSSIVLTLSLLFLCLFFIYTLANAYYFIILFGLSIGFCSSILGTLPIWIAWKLLENKRKGLVVGIAQGCYLLGPFMYGSIFTLVANPRNAKIDNIQGVDIFFGPEVYERVPDCFIWFIGAFALIGAFSIALLYQKNDKSMEKSGQQTVKLLNLLKQKAFWYLFFYLFFKIFFNHFLLNAYKLIGLYYLKNDHAISLISTIAFCSCALLKFASGVLFDRFSWKKINFFLVLIEGFFCVTMPLVFENIHLYGLWLTIALSISDFTHISVWLLCEKWYPYDSWIINLVNLSMIFEMALVNFVQTIVVDVRDK
jgi:MFS family permease